MQTCHYSSREREGRKDCEQRSHSFRYKEILVRRNKIKHGIEKPSAGSCKTDTVVHDG